MREKNSDNPLYYFVFNHFSLDKMMTFNFSAFQFQNIDMFPHLKNVN